MKVCFPPPVCVCVCVCIHIYVVYIETMGAATLSIRGQRAVRVKTDRQTKPAPGSANHLRYNPIAGRSNQLRSDLIPGRSNQQISSHSRGVCLQ